MYQFDRIPDCNANIQAKISYLHYHGMNNIRILYEILFSHANYLSLHRFFHY